MRTKGLRKNGNNPRALGTNPRGKITKRRKSGVKRDRFYSSREWYEVRYLALKRSDGRCQLCGRSRDDGVTIHVDHIKPRSRYPELELELSNLQILCRPCNLGKGSHDETDWRQQA